LSKTAETRLEVSEILEVEIDSFVIDSLIRF